MKENELTVIELTEENIESMVYEIRGQKVMLDFDLARIYGYETNRFNRQVKNNIEKFPEDFMFRLNNDELGKVLRSKKTTLKNNVIESEENSWCKNFTLNKSGDKRGYNIKYLPYAFSEQGIYMLMTVLRGELAVKQSKALIRLFKGMKDYIVESNNLLTTRDILELSNQVNKNTKNIESLKRKGAAMDKKLTKVMDNFINPSTYKHFLILDGKRFEADIAYQQIYSLAKQTILVIDDYIDIKTLELLKSCNNKVKSAIFTDNKAKNSITKCFINDFVHEYNIDIKLYRNHNKFHDRYIIIDYKTDNEMVFSCGSSSKDAGNKITTIMRIENAIFYHDIIDEILMNPEELCLDNELSK